MNIALLLSGGTGTRLKAGIPKQYIEVGGRPIISYCIERLSLHKQIDALWIVADSAWHEQLKVWLEKYDKEKKCRGFSTQGENRQLSVLHGLEDIRQNVRDVAYVLIHDAARPMLSEKLLSECFEAVAGHDGVIPVLPVKDTLYQSENGKNISSLLERSRIFAGQAPELFRMEPYYEANRQLLPNRILEINGSTEPAIMAGMDIVMIQGDEDNFKITTMADLKRFRRRVEENT